jgi:hypothetical protein
MYWYNPTRILERMSGTVRDAWRRRRPQRSHASAPTRSSDDQAPSKRYHEPSADEARSQHLSL